MRHADGCSSLSAIEITEICVTKSARSTWQVHSKVLAAATEAASSLPFLLLYIKLQNVKTRFLMSASKLWLYIALQYVCYQSKFVGRLQLTYPGKDMLPTFHPTEEEWPE